MTEAAPSIRVAIVDDQPLFVFGMRMLVESQHDLSFVDSASDGAAAIELVDRTRPDVVLMDIRMPVTNGLEATAAIVAAGGATRVVILTTFKQQAAVLAAMRCGASAFITKDATPEKVLATIRAVHDSTGLADADDLFDILEEFGHQQSATPVAVNSLTVREREIFLLAARGLSNSEIATAAHISEATVKTHLRGILAKLGLRSRAQIVVFAYENGLVRS